MNVGDRVRVVSGRWAGRTGVLIGYHYNPGNPGGQQGQVYPVVRLDARGRAKAREVRVLAVAPLYQIETRTIEQKGIVLPWKRVEPYGPRHILDDRPPKGTVLDSGEVFIPMGTLAELAEQDRMDSQFGSVFLLGMREGLALEQAGLAEQETRGGYHRTDALMAFMEGAEW